MSQDTKRDRVWKTILELESEPPEYTLYRTGGSPDTIVGFTKADIQATVGDEISKRTIHDVVLTMVEYGLLKMVKEPSYASISPHPITGDRVQADVYRMNNGER